VLTVGKIIMELRRYTGMRLSESESICPFYP